MAYLYNDFYINYDEKKVMVSQTTNKNGTYFTVYLENEEINLKSEGFKTLLWVEKGKGATGLAYKLGRLIERSICFV